MQELHEERGIFKNCETLREAGTEGLSNDALGRKNARAHGAEPASKRIPNELFNHNRLYQLRNYLAAPIYEVAFGFSTSYPLPGAVAYQDSSIDQERGLEA
jgi:hypothetical protein